MSLLPSAFKRLALKKVREKAQPENQVTVSFVLPLSFHLSNLICGAKRFHLSKHRLCFIANCHVVSQRSVKRPGAPHAACRHPDATNPETRFAAAPQNDPYRYSVSVSTPLHLLILIMNTKTFLRVVKSYNGVSVTCANLNLYKPQQEQQRIDTRVYFRGSLFRNACPAARRRTFT